MGRGGVRRSGRSGAACVRLDAREDRRVILAEEAADLGQAVAAVWMVTDAPPELVPRADDAA